MIFMKQFSNEIHTGIETGGERLIKRVARIIQDRNNEIAVEVHGFGIGRLNQGSIPEEQLAAEEAGVTLRHRDYLQSALADSSVADEVLALYDALDTDDSSQEDLLAKLRLLILSSTEQTEEVEKQRREVQEEFELAKSQISSYLDEKILGNRSNRAVMSTWGNAKLAYESGDSSSLKKVLQDHLRSLENSAEKDVVERFLRFL